MTTLPPETAVPPPKPPLCFNHVGQPNKTILSINLEKQGVSISLTTEICEPCSRFKVRRKYRTSMSIRAERLDSLPEMHIERIFSQFSEISRWLGDWAKSGLERKFLDNRGDLERHLSNTNAITRIIYDVITEIENRSTQADFFEYAD